MKSIANRQPQDLLKLKLFKNVLGDDYKLSKKQEAEAYQFLKKYKKPNSFKRLVWFIKYDLDGYTSRMEESIILGSSITKQSMVVRYGDVEGITRWEAYCNRQAETNTFAYKKETHGRTLLDFENYNKSRACSLKNLIKRHGEEKGLELWKEVCDRQRYTNLLEYFIEREGDREVGIEVWKKVNFEKSSKNRIKKLALDNDISLDEAAQTIVGNFRCHRSNGEEIFVRNLEEELNEKIKYSCFTKQVCIWSKELDAPVFYDVCCSKHKKIVEYYGDYWHANPKEYFSDAFIKQTGLTAGEIWKIDSAKQKAALDRGFEVMVIWESEYKLFPVETIRRSAQWLRS
jgi:hypothetical protein